MSKHACILDICHTIRYLREYVNIQFDNTWWHYKHCHQHMSNICWFHIAYYCTYVKTWWHYRHYHQQMSKPCYICCVLTLPSQNLKMEMETRSQVLAGSCRATSSLSSRCYVFTQAMLVALPIVLGRQDRSKRPSICWRMWCSSCGDEAQGRWPY